jgi:hypothetical protein
MEICKSRKSFTGIIPGIIPRIVTGQLLKDSLSKDSLLEKQTHSYLQKPVGVPSSSNSAKIIEASDFTKQLVVILS